MGAEEFPIVIGGPEGGARTLDSTLRSCTRCPHSAWFTQNYADRIVAGQVDTICLYCYMESAPQEGDVTRVSETTLRQLESLGISRHRAYTLMADAEDARKENKSS